MKKRIGYDLGIGSAHGVMEFEKACGSGSYPKNTKEYCSLLKKKLYELNIKSVVDFGCGNLETYKGYIDWETESIDYMGYEINEHCLDELKKRYPNLEFKPALLGSIPKEEGIDAIIIKDVMIHWFDIDIINFFKVALSHYKYIIYSHETTEHGYKQKHSDRRHGAYWQGYGDEYKDKLFDEHLYGFRYVSKKLP
ncbi:hypothetical protein LCGC14_1210890 [marine sediment metagenome]|uniref:Methyltransferase type 11 domain-containing protein n=1 Tax=marine sediment metagenome TaxID=412755 RepID=A0A0F9LDZ8_9ZZZZ